MLIGLGGGAASSLASGASARGSRFRVGAARQRRDAAPLPGGDRSLLGARRRATRSCRSTTSAPAACRTRCPSWCTTAGAARASSCARSRATSPGMSPLELWCNEAQERYVLAIAPERARRRSRRSARASAARTRCVGHATADGRLRRRRRACSATRPVDLPLDGAARQAAAHDAATRRACRRRARRSRLDGDRRRARRCAACCACRRSPTRRSSITIGDRTRRRARRARSDGRAVAGAGRRRAPSPPTGFDVYDRRGDGDRRARRRSRCSTPPPRRAWRSARRSPTSPRRRSRSSSRRQAVGELDGAPPATPARTRGSTTPCAPSGVELCPALGIAIPVGKDSMSMRTAWERARRAAQRHRAAVADRDRVRAGHRRAPRADAGAAARRAATDASCCSSISGAARTGSAARRSRRSTAQLGDAPPDLDDPALLARLLRGDPGAQRRRARSLAYHDRSDGGLFVTLLEMAFAGGVGLDIELGVRSAPIRSPRCSPRSWARCSQVRAADVARVRRDARRRTGSAAAVRTLGRAARRRSHRRSARGGAAAARRARAASLRGIWSETTHAMQALRDDPTCADEEQAARVDAERPGPVRARCTFDLDADVAAPFMRARRAPARRDPARAGRQRPDRDGGGVRPRRLRGGRRPHDRPPRRARSISPASAGLAACGGFSYGDVLGAGEGWAKSILFNAARARRVRGVLRAPRHVHARRLQRLPDDVERCKELIPGADAWPRFVRNRSEQFEARAGAGDDRRRARRCCSAGMAGSRLPIAVAHGEGRAEFADRRRPRAPLERPGLVAARFVDHRGRVDRALPRQPERLARRHHRAHHARRPRHRSSCRTPSACSAPCSYSWHPRAWARGRPLDADLPQRARLGRLAAPAEGAVALLFDCSRLLRGGRRRGRRGRRRVAAVGAGAAPQAF